MIIAKRAGILQILRKTLEFWSNQYDKPAKRSNFIVYSDASASGYGAHLDLNGEQACHKLWEVSDGEKSSTWRELSAIDYALKSFLPNINGVILEMVFGQSESRQNYSSRKYEEGAPRFSNLAHNAATHPGLLCDFRA